MLGALIITFGLLILLLCFLSGLLWSRYKWVPLAVTGAVVVAYAIWILWIAVWAYQCWTCSTSGTDGRGGVFVLSLAFAWIVPAVLIAVTWIGALTSTLVRMNNPARNETHV